MSNQNMSSSLSHWIDIWRIIEPRQKGPSDTFHEILVVVYVAHLAVLDPEIKVRTWFSLLKSLSRLAIGQVR